MTSRSEPARRAWTARLEAFEARLRRLERPTTERRRAAGADRTWVLEGLRARWKAPGARSRGEAGVLAYAGIVQTREGARYQWQGEHRVDRIVATGWDELAAGFAALGHRVRLQLLKAILLGTHEIGKLRKMPGMGTTGQIYHHLRDLQATGWVRQPERNRYVVVPDRVVCVLLMVGILSGPDPKALAPARRARSRR
jgi:hypothetical protein